MAVAARWEGCDVPPAVMEELRLQFSPANQMSNAEVLSCVDNIVAGVGWDSTGFSELLRARLLAVDLPFGNRVLAFVLLNGEVKRRYRCYTTRKSARLTPAKAIENESEQKSSLASLFKDFVAKPREMRRELTHRSARSSRIPTASANGYEQAMMHSRSPRKQGARSSIGAISAESLLRYRPPKPPHLQCG
jgi:hypothetical protein